MKKDVIMVYTGWPMHGKKDTAIIQNMKILDEVGHDIILFYKDKTDKGVKVLNDLLNVDVVDGVSSHDYYESIRSGKYKTWREATNDTKILEDLKQKYNIKGVYIMGGIELQGIKRKEKSPMSKLDTDWNFKYVSIGSYLAPWFVLNKFILDNKLPTREFVHDPLESPMNRGSDIEDYEIYHGVTIPSFNIKRMDNLQYYLNMIKDTPNDKTIDLAFGMTANTKKRYSLLLRIEKALENVFKSDAKLQMFYKYGSAAGASKNINTLVHREKYLEEYIKKSRFTLIAPSYETESFSIFRFLESIKYDCLPLLLENNQIDILVNSYNLDRNIIEQIVVKYNGIELIEENKRLEILEYLKDKMFSNLILP